MPELALPIFLLTYVVVALGRLPGWRIDRAGAALVGAAAMIACGALDFDEALAALDADTLVLLFGMMIVVASLRLSGFFRVVEAAAVRRARHPLVLLVAIVGVSAGLSAFLVNDTICLVLTVPVLELVLRLGRPPLPYLLAVAMAANIGSV
ncbi:SLC13 family permease, partial [Plasticicumulans sp.]